MAGELSQRLEFLNAIFQGAEPISVVDVGANPIEGDAPYKPLLDAKMARVTGFEPQAEALAHLNENKSDLETYLPHALGAGGEATLRIYKHSGFSSLFNANIENASLIGFQREMRLKSEMQIQTVALN